MIRVDNLTRSFGKIQAVDGVDFVANDGQVTGLLGPNGAGKTTTLRILYGLLRPDSGSVQVDETDALASPLAAQERLGVLPDSHGLYDRLTAREHVRYYGEMRGLSGADLERRTAELIDVLGMHEIADRRTAGFSAGERMKVAVSRAIVHDPANVLLDEPTTGLDVMSTRAMRTLIQNLRSQGKCVLFSSHVMQEVSLLCDRIVIIAGGRVVAEGTPDDLCRRAGEEDLENAFVKIIGSDEGLMH
ncbi:MAG: ATP-binding cassette domain-containing protein [Acidobacteriota bacterium]